MVDVEAFASRIVAIAGRSSSEVSRERSGRSNALLWLTGDDHPNIGIIVAPEYPDVQILCDDFTFESVGADAAPELVRKLAAGDAVIVERGWLLKTLVLQVSAEGRTYEAGRPAKGPVSDWEERLLTGSKK